MPFRYGVGVLNVRFLVCGSFLPLLSFFVDFFVAIVFSSGKLSFIWYDWAGAIALPAGCVRF